MMEFVRPYKGKVILQLIELMDIDLRLSKHMIDSKVLEKSLAERASELSSLKFITITSCIIYYPHLLKHLSLFKDVFVINKKYQ